MAAPDRDRVVALAPDTIAEGRASDGLRWFTRSGTSPARANQRERDTLARRFKREARETAALGSIHTIEVYDFGVTEEGDFYYVMELLEGISLERLVQEFGSVDPARSVYLLQQVCHSLGEAHARGLVHRDVKPANILVCWLGPDDDCVKVLDFGLVKHTHDGQTVLGAVDGRRRDGNAKLHGTEIALDRDDVDARSDMSNLAVG